jgi:hypothetical protein
VTRDHAQEATEAISRLQSADPSSYWRVSPPEPGAAVHPIHGARGETAGFVALKPEGNHKVNIGGLVAKPGHSGITRAALEVADRRHPDRSQHLDAFDGHLPQIYAKHGFQETGRLPFDEKYAPASWKPEFGKPDVVFMSRPSARERGVG